MSNNKNSDTKKPIKKTAEQYKLEEIKPNAMRRIQTRLVLETVAKVENIVITDEKVEEEFKKMAESYNMDVETIKQYMGAEAVDQMKKDMAVQEAVTFLVENAVEE